MVLCLCEFQRMYKDWGTQASMVRESTACLSSHSFPLYICVSSLLSILTLPWYVEVP